MISLHRGVEPKDFSFLSWMPAFGFYWWTREVKPGLRRWITGSMAWKDLSPFLLPLIANCFLLAMWWAILPCDVPLSYRLALEPTYYGWKLYKLWARIKLSSFKLWVLDTASRQQRKKLRYAVSCWLIWVCYRWSLTGKIKTFWKKCNVKNIWETQCIFTYSHRKGCFCQSRF